jgi:hypothetical protein
VFVHLLGREREKEEEMEKLFINCTSMAMALLTGT